MSRTSGCEGFGAKLKGTRCDCGGYNCGRGDGVVGGEQNMNYLPGCGIEIVNWCDAVTSASTQTERPIDSIHALIQEKLNGTRPMPYEDTLRVRVYNLIERNLRMHHIESWKMLSTMNSRQFRDWRMYGKACHEILRNIAAEKGYEIAEW